MAGVTGKFLAISMNSKATLVSANDSTTAPVLRSSRDQIVALSTRKASSLAHYKSAIENDPALALNLFVDVNRKLKQAGRPLVADVQRAILFSGMAELPGLLKKAQVLEDMVEPAVLGDLTNSLCLAHHASRQACAISQMHGGLSSSEMLASSLAREGLDFITQLASDTPIKLNTAAFTGLIPPEPENPDHKLATQHCLRLARSFADATQTGWQPGQLESICEEVAELTGTSASLVINKMRSATLEAAREAGHFRNYPPAVSLMLPVDSSPKPTAKPTTAKPKAVTLAPQQESQTTNSAPTALQSAKLESIAPGSNSAARAKKPTAAKPTKAAGEMVAASGSAAPSIKVVPKAAQAQTKSRSVNKPSPAKKDLDGAIDKLNAAAASGKQAAALIPYVLQTICDFTPPRLTVMLMRGSDPKSLNLRLHRGLNVSQALTQIEIPLAHNPLLGELMQKQASEHWLPLPEPRGLTGLPLKLLGQEPGFFYALSAGQKSIGIILACRPNAASLADEDFQKFNRICRSLTVALEQRHRRVAKSSA